MKAFTIGDQVCVKFSSGCINCGNAQTWRVKVLDPENRPLELCVDCLNKIKPLEVEDEIGTNQPSKLESTEEPDEEPVGSEEPSNPDRTGEPEAPESKRKAGKKPEGTLAK